jgi:hypothetical protein
MPERRIPHYRIVRKIGAGGVGEVLLAEDTQVDRALDEYEEGFAKGESMVDILVDPTLDEVRPLPRFQALLQKLGLKK